MQITLIGCPFKTSYGSASESLKKALEKKVGSKVQWVASNCGCKDDVEVKREFQMAFDEYKYFDMFAPSDYRSPQPWKRWAKYVAGKIVYFLRARKYRALSAGSNVVNFQQTLNAYGSTALFYWLNQPSQAARVVTIHELDRYQLARPESNKTYNKADAIIVQQRDMKEQLVGLGVDADRIEIVCHGSHLPTLDENQPREGVVFYGGHHPLKNKGLPEVMQAMAMLKKRLGGEAPRLKVHGYFSAEDLAAVKAMAMQARLENDTVYFNQITIPEAVGHYRSSLVCVLPYKGSFAGLAAATSAAVGLPVIATKNAGTVEHLGDNGIWLERASAEEIATQIERVMCSAELRRDLSKRLRRQAETYLGWDTIAENTLAVYERAIKRKTR